MVSRLTRSTFPAEPLLVAGAEQATLKTTLDVKKSQHLKGTAFDIQIQGWSDDEKAAFVSEAESFGFKGFGFYGPNGHLHIDMGSDRTWGRVPYWARDGLKTPVGTEIGSVVPDQTNNVPGQQNSYIPGSNDPSGYYINSKQSAVDQWLA